MTRRHEPAGPPPTIDSLRADGLTRLTVACSKSDCRHSGDIDFDALRLPGSTPFPTIINRRGFVCTACGGRVVHVMPDWSSRPRKVIETPAVARVGG